MWSPLSTRRFMGIEKGVFLLLLLLLFFFKKKWVLVGEWDLESRAVELLLQQEVSSGLITVCLHQAVRV
jgi:hypothetical protein